MLRRRGSDLDEGAAAAYPRARQRQPGGLILRPGHASTGGRRLPGGGAGAVVADRSAGLPAEVPIGPPGRCSKACNAGMCSSDRSGRRPRERYVPRYRRRVCRRRMTRAPGASRWTARPHDGGPAATRDDVARPAVETWREEPSADPRRVSSRWRTFALACAGPRSADCGAARAAAMMPV